MQNRVCIFSVPRSGSTYLCDVLKTYIAPETYELRHSKDGRMFGHEPFLPGDTPAESIPLVIKEFDDVDRFVLKMQFNELELINNSVFIDKFRSLHTYNIVLLRKDIFEAALSLAVAIAKNEFINFTNFDSIFIDPHSLIYMINFMLSGYNQLINNEHQMHTNEIIFYEDLTFTPKQDFENTQMYKQYPFPIEDCVLDKCEYRAPPKESTVKNYLELKNMAVEFLTTKSIPGARITGTKLSIL